MDEAILASPRHSLDLEAAVITWEQDAIRTVDDLFRRDRLQGFDRRTGTIKYRRRATKIEFRARGEQWYFDRGHVHRLVIDQDPAAIVIDGGRTVEKLEGLQVLAWRDYWPCADVWCDACGPCRDADGLGPLDREVCGVVDTIWFGCNGPTPHFYFASVSASALHAVLMRARTCRHPTEAVADLIVQRPSASSATGSAMIAPAHTRGARYSMPAEYYANVLASVESAGWNVATANPRGT